MGATREDDLIKIREFFNSVADEDGVDNIYQRLHFRKKAWCAGTVLRRAAEIDDVDTVKRFMEGVRLNSPQLSGGLGESALHVAAGCSSLKVLKVLLDGGMDPDVGDKIGERALHYASLAGHVEAVQLLLEARADVRAESSFTEVSVQVARQNPASFLGVDTGDVISVLTQAWQPKSAKVEMLREQTALAKTIVTE